MDADSIELFTGRLLLRALVEVDATALLAIRERWITEGQKSDSVLLGFLQSDWGARTHGVHS